MPSLGDTRRQGLNYQTYARCPDCGVERWTSQGGGYSKSPERRCNNCRLKEGRRQMSAIRFSRDNRTIPFV